MKDEGAGQNKISPHTTENPERAFGLAGSRTTSGGRKFVFENSLPKDNRSLEDNTPDYGKLTVRSTNKSNPSNETGSKSVTKDHVQRRITSDHGHGSLTSVGVTIGDKHETGIGNLKLDRPTITSRMKSFTPGNLSSTADKFKKVTTSKVTEMSAHVSPDNKDGSITIEKLNVVPDCGASGKTEAGRKKHSVKISSKLSKEEDLCFRFPKPDDRFLKLTGNLSDFLLPDKHFAALKLDKLKQVRKLGLKETPERKLGKVDYKQDCSSNNLMESTSTQSDSRLCKSVLGTKRENAANICTSRSSERKQTVESLCGVTVEHSLSHDSQNEDCSQDVHSQSILDVLVEHKNVHGMQKISDGSLNQTEENCASPHRVSSSVQSTHKTTDAFTEDSLEVLNGDKHELPSPQLSPKEFCLDNVRMAPKSERCETMNDSLQRKETEDKPVVPSSFTTSDLEILRGYEGYFEDVDHVNGATSDVPLEDECMSENARNNASQTFPTKFPSESKGKSNAPEVKDENMTERVKSASSEYHPSWDQTLDDQILAQVPLVASQGTPPFVQDVPSQKRSGDRSDVDSPGMFEVCLQVGNFPKMLLQLEHMHVYLFARTYTDKYTLTNMYFCNRMLMHMIYTCCTNIK